MDRAYAVLTLKRADDDQRIIEGMASTPTVDRMGDVVEPLGGKFTTPLPLLLDHDHRLAVGHVEYAEATPAGIKFRARIAKIREPGEAKDIVDKAWQLVKAKLRAAVSIGFKPLPGGVEPLSQGGLRFHAWEWLELSLVSVPANAEATIFSAKSARAAAHEISRHDRSDKRKTRVVRLEEAVATKKPRVVRLSLEDRRKAKIILQSQERLKHRPPVVVRLSPEDMLRAMKGRRTW